MQSTRSCLRKLKISLQLLDPMNRKEHDQDISLFGVIDTIAIGLNSQAYSVFRVYRILLT